MRCVCRMEKLVALPCSETFPVRYTFKNDRNRTGLRIVGQKHTRGKPCTVGHWDQEVLDLSDAAIPPLRVHDWRSSSCDRLRHRIKYGLGGTRRDAAIRFLSELGSPELHVAW